MGVIPGAGAFYFEGGDVGSINGPFGVLPAFEAAYSNPDIPQRFTAPWATDPRLLTKDPASHGITYGEIPKACMRRALDLFIETERRLGEVRVPTMLFYSRDDAVVPPITGHKVLDRLTAAPDKQLVDLEDSAHEATLDFDLERIGLAWLSFIRQHTRVLQPA
jgi:pimeloyl-ACP methyl ester carboxylesterase